MRRAALLMSLVLVPALVAEASAGPLQAAPRRRSPARARNVALVVTLAPMAAGTAIIVAKRSEGVAGGFLLAGMGAVVGPATGLWYAGNRAGLGLLVRAAGVSTAFVGLIMYGVNKGDGYAPGERQGLTIVAVGTIPLLASMVYDIREGPRVVERKNRELMLSPAVIPGPGGSLAPGAALSLRF
jgi:hypothetical protein